jgi:uncharacterized protein (DUF1015 family)
MLPRHLKMAKIIPFRGIYYNRDRVKGSEVAAPPYDVISSEMKDALYSLSPYNVVRIDYGKDAETDTDEENRYTRAARFLDEWLSEGLLIRSEKPTFYAYRVDYLWRGRKMSLTGFFGILRLMELGEGVYPHEDTHSKPKYDRLALLESVGANTSPIYSLYSSPEKKASSALAKATEGAPHTQAEDPDGVVHSFWPIEDKALVEAITEDIDGRDIFIADGHHRYETALDYQRAMRKKTPGAGPDEPYDYVLMFFANIHDEGVTILPTHRMITVDNSDKLFEKIEKYFAIEDLPQDTDVIDAIEGKTHTFGLYYKGGYSILKHKGGGLEGLNPAIKDLDVVVLHEVVFDKLLSATDWGYEMDVKKATGMVDSGRYDAAFFLNPTAVTDIEKVALGSARMPPKSTYFYPKVRTGFVINSLKSF